MRLVILVLVLLLGGTGFAAARCADELNELTAKVERQQKRNPTAQSAAAAKELHRASRDARDMDEIECYNTVARVRHALAAPPAPPPDTAAEK